MPVTGLARICLQMLMTSPFDENTHQFAFVFLSTFADGIQQFLDEFHSIYMAIVEQVLRFGSRQSVRHRMAFSVLCVGSLCSIAVHNDAYKMKVIALLPFLGCLSCAHF